MKILLDLRTNVVFIVNFRLMESISGQPITSNIKKEGKTYSYQDQIWDAKMRQETSRRKRLNSESLDVHELLKESQLTQKQKDSILGELKLEERIRERVETLSNRFKSVCALFRSLLLFGGGVEIRPHLLVLLKPILSGMESPLSNSYCTELWEEICKVLISDRKTGWSSYSVKPFFIMFLSLQLYYFVGPA